MLARVAHAHKTLLGPSVELQEGLGGEVVTFATLDMGLLVDREGSAVGGDGAWTAFGESDEEPDSVGLGGRHPVRDFGFAPCLTAPMSCPGMLAGTLVSGPFGCNCSGRLGAGQLNMFGKFFNWINMDTKCLNLQRYGCWNPSRSGFFSFFFFFLACKG